MIGVRGLFESRFFLTKEILIASGSERDCYLLPGYKLLCVKIQHGRGGKGKQNIQDYKYYRRLFRKGIDWKRLAFCHGWVETNLGKGLVFEFVCDSDGAPSITLKEYIDRHGLSDKITAELEMLKKYLISNNIIVCDLKNKNILCQDINGHIVVKLVDGVGNRDYIKFGNWSTYWGRKKIERHWERFERRLDKLLDS